VVTTFFGSNGLISTGISFIGNLFLKLFNTLAQSLGGGGSFGGGGGFASGIGSLFTGASGGATAGVGSSFAGAAGVALALAGGGLVAKRFGSGGSALRDRIPAFLEPGEYVLRKDAARRIGMSELNRLNRGHQSSMPQGNIQVNVNNQGTSQEPSEQPQIRFDGRKAIVDIFLKDMSSNGPIRQSIRGLGRGSR